MEQMAKRIEFHFGRIGKFAPFLAAAAVITGYGRKPPRKNGGERGRDWYNSG